MVAAIFEAPMSREQAKLLAGLIVDGRSTRPAGVLSASLLYEDGVAQLIAVWRDRDTLDRYLSVTLVPRGVELMRTLGVPGLEPRFRVVEALECW